MVRTLRRSYDYPARRLLVARLTYLAAEKEAAIAVHPVSPRSFCRKLGAGVCLVINPN
jgi:hypothetical protein